MKKNMNPFLKVVLIVLCVLIGLILIASITFACVWSKEIKTISSIKQIVPADNQGNMPVYYMEYEGDFFFEDFYNEQGAKSNEDLFNFVVKKITRGFIDPQLQKGDMRLGCTTYSCSEANGSKIYGRNYDFDQAPVCIVKTNPGNGRHKSISCLDMSKMGIRSIDGDLSLLQRVLMLATPYVTMDGINDAGVSCGVLMTSQGKNFADIKSEGIGTDVEAEKPDLTVTSFLRAILELAESVDDAIEIAKAIDMHEFPNSSFHYSVADAYGKSAIIEWIGDTNDSDTNGKNRKLNIEYPKPGENFLVASNYVSKEGYYSTDMPYGKDRFLYINNRLKVLNGIVQNDNEAFDLLKGVGRRLNEGVYADLDEDKEVTTWSSLYNLSDKTLTFIDNEKFDDPDHKFVFKLD